ncbi:MAG: glycosyltransferase [Ktedonobacteraceae bacterium]
MGQYSRPPQTARQGVRVTTVAPMESSPLRILACTHCDASEGCTFARIVTPLHALQSTGKVTYKHVRNVPWSVAAFWQILRDLSQWDVVWVARPRHYLVLPLIREARRVGKPVLIDIDDWLLEQPDAYNARQWAGTRTSQETMRTALCAADAITTPTSAIAAHCADLGVQAHVVPNAVNCQQFARRPRHAAEPTTIAFCGTMAHRDDTSLIAPGLLQALQKAPGRVRVIAMGCPIPELEGLAGYRHVAAVAATDYPRVLSDLGVDIGLAPLHDTPFNRAKSDIKYLEYSATGAATIASPLAPYEASVHEDRGMLVRDNTPDAWSAAIGRLVDDPPLQQRLARNAYEWVRGERSIEATAHTWYGVFRAYAARLQHGAAYRAERVQSGHLMRVLDHVVLRQVPYYGREVARMAVQHARAAAPTPWQRA